MGVEAVEALAAVKEMAEEEDAIEPAANELATDERAIAELTAVAVSYTHLTLPTTPYV